MGLAETGVAKVPVRPKWQLGKVGLDQMAIRQVNLAETGVAEVPIIDQVAIRQKVGLDGI